MKNKITLKRAIALSAALMLALTAAACGNVDGGADDPADESKAATTTAAELSLQDDSSSQIGSSVDSSMPDVSNAADSSDTDSKYDTPVQIEELDEDFIAGFSDFSAELFKASALGDIREGKNALISPESALMALGMTENGAAGDTLMQMQDTLCGGMELERFNDNMRLMKDNADNAEGLTLNIANSVWVRDDGSDRIKMKDSFSEKVSGFFGAEAFARPFDKGTLDEINGWVNENTNEMIPSIINSISDEAVMYLINAIAFESEWAGEYSDGQIDENGEFTNALGEKQTVTMLNSEEKTYIEDDKATGFVKRYKGGDYAFMAILPNEGVSVEEYASEMTGESLRNLYDSRDRYFCYVETKIPEFTYDYDLSLKDPLIGMGMEQAFTAAADFSEMAETETGLLYISDVVHKTFIKLDREGTKAAAATAVQMNDATAAYECRPEELKYVYLDRPFIYAIVDTRSGIPMFIGAVNTIE